MNRQEKIQHLKWMLKAVRRSANIYFVLEMSKIVVDFIIRHKIKLAV